MAPSPLPHMLQPLTATPGLNPAPAQQSPVPATKPHLLNSAPHGSATPALPSPRQGYPDSPAQHRRFPFCGPSEFRELGQQCRSRCSRWGWCVRGQAGREGWQLGSLATAAPQPPATSHGEGRALRRAPTPPPRSAPRAQQSWGDAHPGEGPTGTALQSPCTSRWQPFLLALGFEGASSGLEAYL